MQSRVSGRQKGIRKPKEDMEFTRGAGSIEALMFLLGRGKVKQKVILYLGNIDNIINIFNFYKEQH